MARRVVELGHPVLASRARRTLPHAMTTAKPVKTTPVAPPCWGGDRLVSLQGDPLERAREHIDAHLFEPLTLTALAEAARLSAYHFSREFGARFGFSPMAYVRARRLAAAAPLEAKARRRWSSSPSTAASTARRASPARSSAPSASRPDAIAGRRPTRSIPFAAGRRAQVRWKKSPPAQGTPARGGLALPCSTCRTRRASPGSGSGCCGAAAGRPDGPGDLRRLRRRAGGRRARPALHGRRALAPAARSRRLS